MGAVDGIAEWTSAQRRVIELVEGPAGGAGRGAGAGLPGLAGPGPVRAHGRPRASTWSPGTSRTTTTPPGPSARSSSAATDDLAALVAEWESVAEPLREWMRANGTRPLGDVIIHEQDLRGALGRPGRPGHAGPGRHPGPVRRLGSRDRPPRCPRSPCWATAGSGPLRGARTTRRRRCAPATSTWPGRWSPAAPPRSCGPGRCAATSPSTCAAFATSRLAARCGPDRVRTGHVDRTKRWSA